jgi:hypothetical protein
MVGPLIAAVLAFPVPDARLEFHLYLGTDSESQCVRQAFSLSRETVSEQHYRLADTHEQLRADIAKVASLHVHELPPRLPNCPHWSLSRYDTPQRFGWVPSQRTGRPVRAWQDTAGILRHLRYIVNLADNQRRHRPEDLVDWTHWKAGDHYTDDWYAVLGLYGPTECLKVYPPMRCRTVITAQVKTPWLKVSIDTPQRWSVDEHKAAERYMDMGTGLVPE